MQHNAPHPGAPFEGYYNKFDLPSGARLIIVISKIKSAKTNPNAVSFTYVPENGRPIYQKEVFVETLKMGKTNSTGNAFILDIPDMGIVKWDEAGMAEYSLSHPDFSFQAQTTSRVPWSNTTDTPEGIFVNLPLPLHWHVHSFASQCSFTMEMPGHSFPSEDAAGEAVVHQEKNWADAFPTAHMWIQGRDGERGLCAAGGQILGMEAFILGYRSPDLNFDMRPPFALRVLGVGPCMSYKMDWESRTFELSVQDLRRKIIVKSTAPKGSFFSLSPPFDEGHRENYLGQSLQATMAVEIYGRNWFGTWRIIREETFEKSGLEFGAGYYPPAGTESKFN